jgi:flagellar biosynthesis/type III secretory pathway protein FliH
MQHVREQLPPDDQVELTEFERRGSSFVRGHREGLEAGREQGLEEGREKGLEKGLEAGLQALRAALRSVLEVRGLSVDEQTQVRIAECSDMDTLRELIARAATITSITDLMD